MEKTGLEKTILGKIGFGKTVFGKNRFWKNRFMEKKSVLEIDQSSEHLNTRTPNEQKKNCQYDKCSASAKVDYFYLA